MQRFGQWLKDWMVAIVGAAVLSLVACGGGDGGTHSGFECNFGNGVVIEIGDNGVFNCAEAGGTIQPSTTVSTTTDSNNPTSDDSHNTDSHDTNTTINRPAPPPAV